MQIHHLSKQTIRIAGVQPNRPRPVLEGDHGIILIVIDQHGRLPGKVHVGMLRRQLFDGTGHECLLVPALSSALVTPAPIPSPDDHLIGKRREVSTEHIGNEFHLRRECDHGQMHGGICRGPEEVEEMGTDVGGQFGRGAVPPASGVNVNYRLVKVNGDKVDLDWLQRRETTDMHACISEEVASSSHIASTQ